MKFFRAFVLGLIALLICSSGVVEAAGYTVYIKNNRRSDCWRRSGFAHDVYTSLNACRRSVQNRINENRRHGEDFESFAIIYTAAEPRSGCLSGQYKVVQQYHPSDSQPKKKTLFYAVLSFRGKTYYIGGYESHSRASRIGKVYQQAYGDRGLRFLRVMSRTT